jgi:glycine/D-amino acid oxidase-like deaminating enzyme
LSTLPGAARVVVIGAGIVGSSMAWHLARLGWRDIVLVEKGMLPNPGGSTGHASNFIFLTDHSREMTALTADSVDQYKEMGVFTQSGGIEVARVPERMEELKRRMASSRSWGIESELVGPAATSSTAASAASARTRVTSRPRSWSSPAAYGARGSARWPVPRCRSPRPSTR